jgi:hypothetical protein
LEALDDYLRGATSINHQVALRANFKMYSRSAKGGEKGDPNRNPWLAKMQGQTHTNKDRQTIYSNRDKHTHTHRDRQTIYSNREKHTHRDRHTKYSNRDKHTHTQRQADNI